MVIEFYFALDWVGNFKFSFGFVIAYCYLIVPNFVGLKNVVVFVFILSSYRVQKYLVDNYYLVGQYYSNLFFVGYFCNVNGFDGTNLHLRNRVVGIL